MHVNNVEICIKIWESIAEKTATMFCMCVCTCAHAPACVCVCVCVCLPKTEL